MMGRLAAVLAIVLAACSPAVPATPSPAAPATGRATEPAAASPPPQTPAPTATAGENGSTAATLTVRVTYPGAFGMLTDVLFEADDELILQRLLMSTIYRRDDSVRPVPDLAAEPCVVDAAGTTVTCRLRDAWFHDGTPVTADDVVFSFETLAGTGHPIAAGRFTRLRAVDDAAVEFVLPEPDATFVDDTLSFVPIASRALNEAAFRQLVQAAAALPPDTRALLDSVDERRAEAEMSDDPETACSELLGELDEIRAAAPQVLPDEVLVDRLPWLHETPPPCESVVIVGELLRAALAARESTGPQALADAYIAVAVHVPRIGSGPFRVAEHTPGAQTVFAAHERYHLGRPAIDRIVARVIKGEEETTEAFRQGSIDLIRFSGGAPGRTRFEALRDEPDTTIASFSAGMYLALQFNIRPGQLFHERELRQALRLCIDKPALVDAATGGTGVAIEGPLLPVHWAYQPDLAATERDVAAGRALIESIGWRLGDDDVYERDGRRLAAEIWVRANANDRVAFAELVADRAADCGMELTPRTADFGGLLRMVDGPPFHPPGRAQPFDIYLAGWNVGYEPHTSFSVFLSEKIPHETPPPGSDLFNYIGYSNPEFDRLAEAARTSYDERERARHYRQLQDILAEDVPYIFGWAFGARSYFTRRLTSLGGELNLQSPLWDWQLEKLTLAADRP